MKNIKKYLILFIACIAFQNIFAQKLGYVDSNMILGQMEEYQKAQTALQEQITKWKVEAKTKFEKVEKMQKAYDKEEILLTEELKAEKLAKIKEKDEEARAFQERVFGYEGMMFQRQEELMKPVREELYKAVQSVARRNGIQMMFDKASSEYSLIFVEPRHDYTIAVLAKLGITDEEGNPIPPEDR